MATQTAGMARTGPVSALNPDPLIDPALAAAFPALCAAAGIPNAKWRACWTAVMVPGVLFDASIEGQALLDTAIRTWWKAQGGVILGTALIVGSALNG